MALLPYLSFFNSLLSDMRFCNALDTRYFMIKSWNVENVEMAQRNVSRSVHALVSNAHHSHVPVLIASDRLPSRLATSPQSYIPRSNILV